MKVETNLKLTIAEVERLTNLKVVDMIVSKNWIRLVLENGLIFAFKKWN